MEKQMKVLEGLVLPFGVFDRVGVVLGEYASGGVALQLFDMSGGVESWGGGEEGELLVTVSVFVEGFVPAEGCVWVKTWSENEGVLESLVSAGVLKITGRSVPLGFVSAVEAKVLV